MDRQLLIEKISELEKKYRISGLELREYEYNDDLLLVEKKEWISMHEQFLQALGETKELLLREKIARPVAISEVIKREDKLWKALEFQRRRIIAFEKNLCETCLEDSEIQLSAESELEEAHTLCTSFEARSLEVEAKLSAADAKLAEVSRMAAEIQRKSVEMEAKESLLMKERTSFNAERDAHGREMDEKVANVVRSMEQISEQAKDIDRILKQKQPELEEEKRIILEFLALKSKEDEISTTRTEDLSLKEKEAAAMRTRLEEREKELLELQEKLNARDLLQVEFEKLLNKHKVVLDAKALDFEMEMEQRKKSLDDKVVEVEKKEIEVSHLEGKIAEREQALQKELEKIKEKEAEIVEQRSKLNDEKSQMLHEFELQKQQFQTEMQNKEADIENRMREGETSFGEERPGKRRFVRYL